MMRDVDADDDEVQKVSLCPDNAPTFNVTVRWQLSDAMTTFFHLTSGEANLSVSWQRLDALQTENQCPWWSAELNPCIHQ